MPRSPKLFRYLLPAIVLVTAMTFAGCGSSSSSQASGTRIRFVNASVNQSSLNVLIDGVSVSTGLANGGGATAYLPVASGSRHIQMQDPTTLQSFVDSTISLADGSATTFIAADFSPALKTLVLTDDNTAPATGSFKVRAVNVAPNLSTNADAYVETAGTDINTVLPTVSNIIYPGASSYIVNTAGSYEVEFTQAGQKGIGGGQPAGGTPIAFTAGQVATVLVVEDINGIYSTVQLVDVK
jgi:Domain of unknown function (DUF4397)